MKRTHKTIIWMSFFAIAMGFLESAVVIYLRALYYADGFEFPLRTIPLPIARVEFLRELATVIMLIAAGIFAGRTKLERFAYFIFAFAVWDLFYYVFLYLCLGWPQSLSTWDILFLIPVPWVGPVWAPCLLCLLMIIGSLYFIRQTDRYPGQYRIEKNYWLMMITGALICILAFMWDYLVYTYKATQPWSVLSSEQLFSDLKNYIPQQFNYVFFLTGFFFMCLSLALAIFKPHTNKSLNTNL